MIVYRDIVERWLVPMGKALNMPVVPLDGLKADQTEPLIAYDVAEPYIDCSPHHAESQGMIEKVVEMEWLLLIRSKDRMDMVERCRDLLGWQWTEGLECLTTIPAVKVHMGPAQWKTEPTAGLGLRIRLRMKDRFERNFTFIEKVELQRNEKKE